MLFLLHVRGASTPLHGQSWDVSLVFMLPVNLKVTASNWMWGGGGFCSKSGFFLCFGPITNSLVSIFRNHPVISVLQKARNRGLVCQLFLLWWWTVALFYPSAGPVPFFLSFFLCVWALTLTKISRTMTLKGDLCPKRRTKVQKGGHLCP